MAKDNRNFLIHYGRSDEDGAPQGTGNYKHKSKYREYGMPRHAGLYNFHNKRHNPEYYEHLLERIRTVKARYGKDEVGAAKELGYSSTNELRNVSRLANFVVNSHKYEVYADMFYNKGMGYTEIARTLGLPNESSVRSVLTSKKSLTARDVVNTANVMKERIDNGSYVNISLGAAERLGVSKVMLDNAIDLLKLEGYQSFELHIQQMGSKKGQKTNITCMCPEDVDKRTVYQNIDKIKMIKDTYSEDGGDTFVKREPPVSIDSKRIYINYAEDGGVDKDGVIEIRPGVEDLSLGKAHAVQARIAVDDKYYLKGMAVYGTDIPEGYDIVLNSNKHKGTPPEDVFKKMNIDKETGKVDTENPFGALTKDSDEIKMVNSTYVDKDGNVKQNAINVVNEEGDWFKWKDKLSPQFLSKQLPEVIRGQAEKTVDQREKEFNELMSLTNPTLKKKFLESFAEECDTASVQLKLAPFTNQKFASILPVNTLKENEVYAPNHQDGDHIYLVRFPHTGPFEIPELIVNNQNPEAKKMIGNARDIIGINHKVAPQLSGADFDGDTVLVINSKDYKVRTQEPFPELLEFDTKIYKLPDSVTKAPDFKKMADRSKQTEMGSISNLISDMQQRGCSSEDLINAVKYSMVAVDAQKHDLDWGHAKKELGINQLYKDYGLNGKPGASTLITRAKNEKAVDEMEKVKLRDMTPEERERWRQGEEIYRKTGRKEIKLKKVDLLDENGNPVRDRKGNKIKVPYLDENGKKVYEETGKLKKEKRPQMSLVDDAYDLISAGTEAEYIYADFANRMKAMAKEARRVARNMEIPSKNTSKELKEEYREEIHSLEEKVKAARANRPLEQQANLEATKKFQKYKQDHPDMGESEEKKQRGRYIKRARQKYKGLKADAFEITDREWEAIQKHVISSSQQQEIFKYTDQDKLKKRALPKSNKSLSMAELRQAAKDLAKAGSTNARVAADYGISVKTLYNELAEAGIEIGG